MDVPAADERQQAIADYKCDTCRTPEECFAARECAAVCLQVGCLMCCPPEARRRVVDVVLSMLVDRTRYANIDDDERAGILEDVDAWHAEKDAHL